MELTAPGAILEAVLQPRLWWQPAIAAALMLLLALAAPHLRSLSPLALANTCVSLLFFLTNLLLSPLTGLFKLWLRGLWAGAGLPELDAAFWAALPFPVGVLAGLIAADFVLYVMHRALHTAPGWPIHAIHHSDSQVNGFTAWRVHPLQILVTSLCTILITGWLGLPPAQTAAVAVILGLHSIYVHLEVDIDHGPLRHVIASPHYHRWHHRDTPEAYTTNLANTFPIWDLMFGTYREPVVLPAPIGAAGDGVPDLNYARLMLLPFRRWAGMLCRWWRMRPESSA